MKNYIMALFFVFTSLNAFSQASVKTLRVMGAAKAIGENVPVGTILIDVSTNKMFLVKAGMAKTETINGSTASVELINTTIVPTVVVNDVLTGGALDALSAEQGKVLKDLVDTNEKAIVLNTAKVSNISTNLSVTGTTDARTIVSSDGTDAIIPVATTAVSGLMSTKLFDAVTANTAKSATVVVNDVLTGGALNALSAEQGKVLKDLVDTNEKAIVLNTAKVSNVSTNLSVTGTTDARTIVSSDGTDAIIPVATTAVSGLMSTKLFDAVTANTAKSATVVVNDVLTGGALNALSAEQGKVLKDLVDVNEKAIALNTAKKQTYLYTETFSESSNIAIAHQLTKTVASGGVNKGHFKVTLNGGEILPRNFKYDSVTNTIKLYGVYVYKYDAVTVVYDTEN